MSVDQDERTPGAFRSVADLDVDDVRSAVRSRARTWPRCRPLPRSCGRSPSTRRRRCGRPRRWIAGRSWPSSTAASSTGPERWPCATSSIPASSTPRPPSTGSSSTRRPRPGDPPATTSPPPGRTSASGTPSRSWPSVRRPTFVAYFANPVLDLVCESWFGPGLPDDRTGQRGPSRRRCAAPAPRLPPRLPLGRRGGALSAPDASGVCAAHAPGCRRALGHGRRIRSHPAAALLPVLRPRFPGLPAPRVRGLLQRALRAAPAAQGRPAVLQPGAVPRRR